MVGLQDRSDRRVGTSSAVAQPSDQASTTVEGASVQSPEAARRAEAGELAVGEMYERYRAAAAAAYSDCTIRRIR